jgi:hypothetical protein
LEFVTAGSPKSVHWTKEIEVRIIYFESLLITRMAFVLSQ